MIGILLAALSIAGPAAGPPPGFTSEIRPLTAAERRAMTPSVWRQGCPVGLGELRVVVAAHVDFVGRVRLGRLVVHADVARDVESVLRELFVARFPIRRMVPIEAYGGDDFASIEADNTSAFNCRPATGSRRWSQHAYGRAIDLNPLENPYVSGGRTSHPASVPFVSRRTGRGVVTARGPVVRAFSRIGWGWGGRWSGVVDYQHFSQTGG